MEALNTVSSNYSLIVWIVSTLNGNSTLNRPPLSPVQIHSATYQLPLAPSPTPNQQTTVAAWQETRFGERPPLNLPAVFEPIFTKKSWFEINAKVDGRQPITNQLLNNNNNNDILNFLVKMTHNHAALIAEWVKWQVCGPDHAGSIPDRCIFFSRLTSVMFSIFKGNVYQGCQSLFFGLWSLIDYDSRMTDRLETRVPFISLTVRTPS